MQYIVHFLDDIITTNPTPPEPAPELLAERRRLIIERNALIDKEYDLRGEIEDAQRDISENRAALKRAKEDLEKEEDDDTQDPLAKWGTHTMFIERTVPINIGAANVYNLDKYIKRLKEEIQEAENTISEKQAELQNIVEQKEAVKSRLRALPEDPNANNNRPAVDSDPGNPDLELDDLGSGDGESILFTGRDPFARALMRYRGFRLDVAETGEGFSDSVKPLSFTRTLSSTMVGWVRAVYTDYEQDDASQQEGDNILVALGIHKDFNDDLRVGLFATSTWGNVSSPVNNLDIDTTGYSLGAYGRYKWGEIDVNASTRIGLTDNDISVSGTTGSYDTRLASATLGISGEEQLSDDVWMRPAISVTGTWVNREDYVNSAGTAIGGNTTWSGNVTAGPTIGTSLTPPEGLRRLEPAIGLQAVYTFSDQDTQSGTVTASEDDYLSLAVSPQLSLEFNNGASLDVFGSYFGIGADLDGWSVGGTFSIPLN